MISDPDPICSDGQERLRFRISNPEDATAPTLVYLPGIHGDWTLVQAFRKAMSGRVRFVEITYPRNPSWQLCDYAREIESGLASMGIQHGWLLGESFGSQVLWELTGRGQFRPDGLILAGGFVKYPLPWLLNLTRRICPSLSHRAVRRALPWYVAYARFRFAKSPESIQGARDFAQRRTPADHAAIVQRLDLIASNDPREIAATVRVPVHLLSGGIDPVVCWPWVSRWLRRHCPGLRGIRIIWPCDHTVLTTASEESAAQVRQWMS
ncbi:MAG: alpha/beta hydrolase [Verrucomicrobia bacterium]|nr:alpha/beta hydrolase [Verrucomicrobiota bacterium]